MIDAETRIWIVQTDMMWDATPHPIAYRSRRKAIRAAELIAGHSLEWKAMNGRTNVAIGALGERIEQITITEETIDAPQSLHILQMLGSIGDKKEKIELIKPENIDLGSILDDLPFRNRGDSGSAGADATEYCGPPPYTGQRYRRASPEDPE